MPGMFSNIFDTDEGQSSQAQDTSTEVEGGAVIPVHLDVQTEVSGTYQNPDGSTSSWSSSHDVSLDAEVDASFAAVLSTATEQNSLDTDIA